MKGLRQKLGPAREESPFLADLIRGGHPAFISQIPPVLSHSLGCSRTPPATWAASDLQLAFLYGKTQKSSDSPLFSKE